MPGAAYLVRLREGIGLQASIDAPFQAFALQSRMDRTDAQRALWNVAR
jgi:hypothetical protein